jgi:hypothetical protein
MNGNGFLLNCKRFAADLKHCGENIKAASGENSKSDHYAPNASWIAPAMLSARARIFSSDSASTITRARVSVPE